MQQLRHGAVRNDALAQIQKLCGAYVDLAYRRLLKYARADAAGLADILGDEELSRFAQRAHSEVEVRRLYHAELYYFCARAAHGQGRG